MSLKFLTAIKLLESLKLPVILNCARYLILRWCLFCFRNLNCQKYQLCGINTRSRFSILNLRRNGKYAYKLDNSFAWISNEVGNVFAEQPCSYEGSQVTKLLDWIASFFLSPPVSLQSNGTKEELLSLLCCTHQDIFRVIYFHSFKFRKTCLKQFKVYTPR